MNLENHPNVAILQNVHNVYNTHNFSMIADDDDVIHVDGDEIVAFSIAIFKFIFIFNFQLIIISSSIIF